MFASAQGAQQFRRGLKRPSIDVSTEERSKTYAKNIGPFTGLNKTAASSSIDCLHTTLDKAFIRSVNAVSKNVLMASPIQTVVESSRGAIRVMRGDQHVTLTTEFQCFLDDTFQRIMCEAMRQLLMFGVCVVAVLDKPDSDEDGTLQPLQRSDVASYGGKARRGSTAVGLIPIVIDIADETTTFSFSDEGGLRRYRLQMDGVDPSLTSDPNRIVLSVTHPPTRDGTCTSLVANLMPSVVEFEAHSSICLDVALELARPTTLLQERHGPSASRGGVDAMTASNLFFDTESASIAQQQKKDNFAGILDMLNEINRRQTTVQEPKAAGNVQREFQEPRLHVISQGLETATHAVIPSRASLIELTSLRHALSEEINTAFGVPPGLLRHGDGQKTSSSSAQSEMFKQRCHALRSSAESILSAIWHRMGFAGSLDDRISIVPSDTECRDLDKIIALHSAGLLPTDVASHLVSNAMNLSECGIRPKDTEGATSHDLALRSPRASTAPSEAGGATDDA